MQSIQTRLMVTLVLAGLVLTCPGGFQAFGGDSKWERETFRGLHGVAVLVENIKPEAERDGLTQRQVQTDVELRLRQAGLRVLTRKEVLAAPGTPYLYININAIKRDNPQLYIVHITVALDQSVLLERDPAITVPLTPTWSIGWTGSTSQANLRQAREIILDHVDQFINAYLAENPVQAGAGRHSGSRENLIPDASIIRAVQWQLQEAGFYLGAVDGKFGTHTRLALQQYQTRQGLPATGEFDEVTRRALGLR